MISKSWLEKKNYISFVANCRNLKKKDRKTKADFAIDHFGTNGTKSLKDTAILLRVAYYIIGDTQQGKVFGPVPCKLRQCANPNCGIELEPWGPDDGGLQKCPQCGKTEWRAIGVAVYWYIATGPREHATILHRWGVNADGNLRRFFGGDEYPNLRKNLVRLLGAPAKDMLDYPSLKQAAKELMPSLPPKRMCHQCQKEFYADKDAKLCPYCGAIL